ncbi:MAG: M56 family metallopeptidase [Bacillota bacterium]
MSAFDTFLDTPFAYHLGWTLVHFLWQGFLVGAAYACARPLLKDAAPATRYWLSLGALGTLAVLPVITFMHLATASAASPVLTGFADGARIVPVQPAPTLLDVLRQTLHPLIPWTVPAWCTGVTLLALKSFMAWQRARILTRKAAAPAPEVWQKTLAQLAIRVGVRIHIELLVTAKIAVPCVVGWLKPVILLPPSAFTGLSSLQLEMVLAHELSHIRRLDYLVNLMQVAVETLLFYHPVVRWISRDVRRERELCCDDSAVQACGDALHYAHALTDLELLRGTDVSPAMGVNGGDLMMRVERLITPHHVSATAPRLTGVMLISALCLGGLLAMASARNMPSPALQNLVLPLLHAPTPAVVEATPIGRSEPVLPPTQAGLAGPGRSHGTFMRALRFNAASLQEVTAPVLPPAPATSTARAETPLMAGAPLSTLLDPNNTNTLNPLNLNRHASAQMIVVNVNGSAPVQNVPHEYCEPVTGSRVCN